MRLTQFVKKKADHKTFEEITHCMLEQGYISNEIIRLHKRGTLDHEPSLENISLTDAIDLVAIAWKITNVVRQIQDET